MIGIDLFAGAGGLTLGAVQAGIRVIAAVENDVHAAATYRRNFPNIHLIEQDIATIPEIHVSRRGEPLVLFGGPPCQGFSTSNQRNRNAANPRNWLFREFIRMIDQLEPDWVIFENVRGILETEQGRFLQNVMEELRAIGYTSEYHLLNAVNYGVPQRRSRVFVLASRTRQIPQIQATTTIEPIRVVDAIGDLPYLDNGACIDTLAYATLPNSNYSAALREQMTESTGHLVTRNARHITERYGYIRQGGNWEDIPETLMNNYRNRNACHTGIYHRLDATRPSIVIGNFRKNMLIHPVQHRGLSVREAARLQSFPDGFRFCGTIGFQQQQVGNAVPPMLAQAVFEAIARQ